MASRSATAFTNVEGALTPPSMATMRFWSFLRSGQWRRGFGILAAVSFVTELTMRPWLRLHAWSNSPERKSTEALLKYEDWRNQGHPGESLAVAEAGGVARAHFTRQGATNQSGL